MNEAETYRQACATDFWQRVFRAEADYLAECLNGCVDVLSVGCGPSNVEGALSTRGFHVTGLDVSAETLATAPPGVRRVAASAEAMPFATASFDAVISVVSLQFVADISAAVAQAARVLRPGGRLIALLLNPAAPFVRQRLVRPDSHMRHLRHLDLTEIEQTIAERFSVQTEYFLGVTGTTIFDCRTATEAVLYVIKGRVTQHAQGDNV